MKYSFQTLKYKKIFSPQTLQVSAQEEISLAWEQEEIAFKGQEKVAGQEGEKKIQRQERSEEGEEEVFVIGIVIKRVLVRIRVIWLAGSMKCSNIIGLWIFAPYFHAVWIFPPFFHVWWILFSCTRVQNYVDKIILNLCVKIIFFVEKMLSVVKSFKRKIFVS